MRDVLARADTLGQEVFVQVEEERGRVRGVVRHWHATTNAGTEHFFIEGFLAYTEALKSGAYPPLRTRWVNGNNPAPRGVTNWSLDELERALERAR